MNSLREALYYEKLEENNVKCILCPHNCVIKNNRTGICRVRKNIDGTLYSLTDGIYISSHLDPIEKKPLSRFHQGSMIYSVGTAGCNLNCDFCQNWQLVYQDIEKYQDLKIDDEYILKKSRIDGSIGIAFTYNEPTVNYECMLRLAKKAKEIGLVTAAISNGYLNEEPMRELAPYIDAWNIDLKSISNDFYKKICKANLEPVLRNIAIANENSHVEVTSLLIDGQNTSDKDIEGLAKSLADIDSSIVLHLSRYFPAYKRTTPPTPIETMQRARQIAKKYMTTVLLGNC